MTSDGCHHVYSPHLSIRTPPSSASPVSPIYPCCSVCLGVVWWVMDDHGWLVVQI